MLNCCSHRVKLLVAQRTLVDTLLEELFASVEDENELYAKYVIQDIKVAASLARLIHKCNDSVERVK